MQRDVIRLIAAALLLSSSSVVFAANWRYVGQTDTMTVYVDMQTARSTRSKAKAWFLFDLSTPKQLSGSYPVKSYQSQKHLNVFDCAAGTSGTAQYASYSGPGGTGDVVDSFSLPPLSVSLSKTIPDTIGEAMLNAACYKQKAGKSM